MLKEVDPKTKDILNRKFQLSEYKRDDILEELSEEEEKFFTNELLPIIIEKLDEIQKNYKEELKSNRKGKR